jgi:hypothetical protein
MHKTPAARPAGRSRKRGTKPAGGPGLATPLPFGGRGAAQPVSPGRCIPGAQGPGGSQQSSPILSRPASRHPVRRSRSGRRPRSRLLLPQSGRTARRQPRPRPRGWSIPPYHRQDRRDVAFPPVAGSSSASPAQESDRTLRESKRHIDETADIAPGQHDAQRH